MFTLIDNTHARIGKFNFPSKEHKTPCFFMTSNFGGGAADIYRIVTYTDLLESSQIPVLHNYYYLTVGGTFKVKWTSLLPKFKNINHFLLFIRDQFVKLGYCIGKYSNKKLNWDPVTLLDSGSGNFLRDEIKSSSDINIILKSFDSKISVFADFCIQHEINIMMSMDFAGKYTHKQGEKDNHNYNILFKGLSSDIKNNLELLEKTLNILKSKTYDFLAYAPIHGNSPKDYAQFVENVLKLESHSQKKFDGFAIGGIANYREKDNKIWGIPESSNSRIKAGIIVSKAVKAVRTVLDSKQDMRPIHGLGVGSVELIIPLVHAGSDSFDAHSAWRRATDGSRDNAKFVNNYSQTGSFSKFLIPLLDDKENVILQNNNKTLKYLPLNKLPNTVFCDCEVCKKYSISEIKSLYSNDGEDFNFAKILSYVHAILQHQKICSRLHNDLKNKDSVQKLVNEIPDKTLQDDLRIILKSV
jgi:tRNA-guanine family transglycosylase